MYIFIIKHHLFCTCTITVVIMYRYIYQYLKFSLHKVMNMGINKFPLQSKET